MWNIISSIGWFIVGVLIWGIFIYILSYYKYGIKKRVDEYFRNLKRITKEKKDLENKLKELKKYTAILEKDLEESKREINEKNKYLAEDKVVLKRLARVKSLSDNIASILQEYDEVTIKRLLAAYGDTDIMEEEDDDDKKNKIKWNKQNLKTTRIWW